MLINLKNIQFQRDHLDLIVKHNQKLGARFQDLVNSVQGYCIIYGMDLTDVKQRLLFSMLETELRDYMNKESERLFTFNGKFNLVTENDFDKFYCFNQWFKLVCSALSVMYPDELEWSAYHYVPGGILMVYLSGGAWEGTIVAHNANVFTLYEKTTDLDVKISTVEHKYFFNPISKMYDYQGMVKKLKVTSFLY